MKHLLLFIFLCLAFTVRAQDIITLLDGETIECKVTKIGLSEIEYKKLDNLDGPLYIMEKSLIFMITYEGGTKDVFSIQADSSTVVVEELNVVDLRNFCEEGRKDAMKYRNGVGHVVAGALFGVFAVIGAAIAHPSPEKHLRTLTTSKNKDIFNNPNYKGCYIREAKKGNIIHTCMGWIVSSLAIFLIVNG